MFAQKDSLNVEIDNNTIIVKKFDNSNLEDYKSQKEFNYEIEKVEKNPGYLAKIFNWLGRIILRFLEWIFGDSYGLSIFGFLIKIFPYLILATALFFLLRFFIKSNSNAIIQTKNNKAIVSISEEEDLIRTKDLPNLIKKAIEQKNFRLAVRFYYLMILKQLENKDVISWEQQKTNEDYIKEISKKNIKKSFINLTRLYDFVWYGNFDINEFEFAKVEADFQRTNKLISK